jgi:wobble nucleotide-excising tRNase
MAMKYDDTYIVKRILLRCDEVITEYTYRDEVITDTEAYFVAVELRDWIHKFKKKGLQEKLAELYDIARDNDPDTASVISMAEDTLRRSK